MGLFSRFFSKKVDSKKLIDIIAPISGNVVGIEKVPDTVFSDKIVGDGVAIQPVENLIVSPVNGIIGKIFESMHAFSVESNDGIEMFVHFGIDTVQLKGRGFKQLAKEKQSVTIGDPILQFDLVLLKKIAKSVLTPVVISNMDDIKKLNKIYGEVIRGKTIIMTAEL
ncbi:PTS system glucose-specific EIIA component [Buchnera aphidicola (Anoecia corni)]|uniref:PTS system glucose-specific EIIA component n=1 Tax=Buchnera aphidicola (Anoecia corni) TaxID=2994477 RepID=A0AAT9IGG5_9GAMM